MLVISGRGATPVEGVFIDTIVLVDKEDELETAPVETAVVVVADGNTLCELPPELVLLPLLDYKNKHNQFISTGITGGKTV
jgi:hypothetical protein